MTKSSLTIIPWEVFNREITEQTGFEFTTLDRFLLHIDSIGRSLNWIKFENWEDFDDQEIYANVVNIKKPQGRLYIITEVSYKENFGPFMLNATEIREFVGNHLKKYGECFFNGDVIIFSFEYNLAWLFHHEGMYSLIELPQSKR